MLVAGTFNSPWDHYYRPYDQQAEKRRWGEGVLWMKRKREEECDSDDDSEGRDRSDHDSDRSSSVCADDVWEMAQNDRLPASWARLLASDPTD